ncbi:NAD(P)H-binding protein [Ammoniphilus sp. CFH 90114]|uniref:NAD(P)H-binding protein n=1 Tax=Ammoniphilus sp. CFH 90114 TaxID=2493665 RepID=UPI001F0BA711|nr:NAD(P)H-binding protein [Ammoniphilus sp. CFH 90114]
MKKALIIGATGLVGKEVLNILLEGDTYESITILVRKKPSISHGKLVCIVLDDFSNMEQHSKLFQVDDVYCCLGTTIKKAKTKENFKQVDFTYPLMAAQLAKEYGVKRFLLVSAMGADSRSSIFYNRVKGELELAVQQIHLPSFLIFRPSLLLGERAELRVGERMASLVFAFLPFLFKGALIKYRPIEGRDVASMMVRMAETYLPGTHIFENDQMYKILSKGTNK